jgi:hypothetical protein
VSNDLETLTRGELNERASAAGIDNPESMRSKADVIAAIRKAGAPSPAAPPAAPASETRSLTARRARALRLRRRQRGQ